MRAVPTSVRRQHVEGEVAHLDGVAGTRGPHRDPLGVDLVVEVALQGGVVGTPGLEEHADREPRKHLRQAADVIGMRMRRHNRIETLDAVRHEQLRVQLVVGTAVDQHGRPAGTRDKDRIALPDIQHADRQAARRPGAERDLPHEHRRQRETRDHRAARWTPACRPGAAACRC